MNKKDILELKRRLTKDGCTITQMCGCYVNSEKSKISLISVKNFLNMDDEEFYKYLDIAKKTLSGILWIVCLTELSILMTILGTI